MTCHYNFSVESYHTLSTACFNCPFNQTDCFRPDCIPGNGIKRSVTVINRMLPGPAVQVRVLQVALNMGWKLGEQKNRSTLIHHDWNDLKQESPPAWTQEAYRPPCSEYSFCCPTRVPPRGGTQVRVPPWGGTQTPRGRGYPGLGTPPGAWVPPHLDLGTPPPQGGLGTPPGGSGYPPGGGTQTWVPPPGGVWVPPQGGTRTWVPPLWTDKHLWKQYLPIVLRTRAVIKTKGTLAAWLHRLELQYPGLSLIFLN